MHEMIKKTNKVLIGQVIKNLAKRNMEGFYAEDKKEALELAKKFLVGSKIVSNGGSETIKEIGLVDELRSGKYEYLDRDKCKDYDSAREIYIKSFDADAYIGSVNAITVDGILVNIDGNSNRVSAYAYGPKKLILIVGVQKITNDLDSAIKRARNVVSPANCTRLNKETPCVKLGYCADCLVPDTICCEFLITRYSRHKDRIKIILVNETIGF